MYILPAIDLYDSKVVRLYKGQYNQMTIYSNNPLEKVSEFEKAGAEWIHIVDLEGARDGTTANIETISSIANNCSVKFEVGGGIRNEQVVETYINVGASRVILGTAAIENPEFLSAMVDKYGDKIAVGVDCKDGKVMTKGWLETNGVLCDDFCEKLENMGVSTIICTDISKDGALKGPNFELYERLKSKFKMNIIASGGISTIDDIAKLRELDVYGTIVGKAYYSGNVDLKEAVEVSR